MGAPLNGGIQLFRYSSHRPHLPLYGDLPGKGQLRYGRLPADGAHQRHRQGNACAGTVHGQSARYVEPYVVSIGVPSQVLLKRPQYILC